MNWDALGAIAELIGAIAVVATLIYLAAQIRQNTLSNRNAALQTVSSQYADWLSTIIENESVARIYRAGLADFTQLTEEDRIRFGMLLTHLCRACDAQYHQHTTNALPQEMWERACDAQYHQHTTNALPQEMWESTLESLVGVLEKPGGSTWWSKYGARFSPSFYSAVSGALETSGRVRQ